MFVNRKVEDLQFTIEEQSINQDEVEVCQNLFSLLSSQIFLFANFDHGVPPNTFCMGFLFLCLQATTETEHAKVKALEIKLKEEEAKVTKLSKELETWKVCHILDIHCIMLILSCARLVNLAYILLKIPFLCRNS